MAKADSLGSKVGLGVMPGGRGASPAEPGVGSGLGEARLVFFLAKCGAWLGVDGFPLLLAKPRGAIDFRVGGRRGGFPLRGAGATVRDQVFHGHDTGSYPSSPGPLSSWSVRELCHSSL